MRARIRLQIRSFLKDKYPPDDQASAIELVLQQAELVSTITLSEDSAEPLSSTAPSVDERGQIYVDFSSLPSYACYYSEEHYSEGGAEAEVKAGHPHLSISEHKSDAHSLFKDAVDDKRTSSLKDFEGAVTHSLLEFTRDDGLKCCLFEAQTDDGLFLTTGAVQGPLFRWAVITVGSTESCFDQGLKFCRDLSWVNETDTGFKECESLATLKSYVATAADGSKNRELRQIAEALEDDFVMHEEIIALVVAEPNLSHVARTIVRFFALNPDSHGDPGFLGEFLQKRLLEVWTIQSHTMDSGYFVRHGGLGRRMLVASSRHP